MYLYLITNGQRKGPYSPEQMCVFLERGRVIPTDQVWAEGWPSWRAISEIPTLGYACAPLSEKPVAISERPDGADIPGSAFYREDINDSNPGISSDDEMVQPDYGPSKWLAPPSIDPRCSSPREVTNPPFRFLASLGLLIVGLVALICTGIVVWALVTSIVPSTPGSFVLHALRQDGRLGKQYQAARADLQRQNLSPDNYCDQEGLLVDRLVTAMRNIDLSGCPEEFKKAYLEHAEAWHEFGNAMANHPHVTSDGEGAFGSVLVAALTQDPGSVLDYAGGVEQQNDDFVNTLKGYNRAIYDSWNNVQNSALACGVKPGEYQ